MTQGILIALLVFETLLILWMSREKGSPQVVCGCKHHRCFHDDEGKCHVAIEGGVWNKQTNRYETVACGCQQYIGPVTLDQYIEE